MPRIDENTTKYTLNLSPRTFISSKNFLISDEGELDCQSMYVHPKESFFRNINKNNQKRSLRGNHIEKYWNQDD